MLRIRLETPGAEPREIATDRREVVIGRGEQADIRVDDPRASRRHCRLEVTPQGVVVEDLGSANGTYIGKEPVRRALLEPGQVLLVGRTRVRVLGVEEGARTQTGEAPAAEPLREARSAEATDSATPPAPPPAGAGAGAPADIDRLELISGRASRSRIPLGNEPVRIGRARDNDVVLEDLRVSSHHARIVRKNGTYVIEDLESKNGTFVDGKRVSRTSLRHGSLLAIGAATFRVHLSGAEDKTPPGVGSGGAPVPIAVDARLAEETPAGQPLAAVAVVLLILLLGYFGIDAARRFLVREDPDPPSPANRIVRNWSFEEESPQGVPGWVLGEGDQGRLERTEEGAQYPGRFALRLVSLADPDFCRAYASEPVTLGAQRTFVLRGYAAERGALLTGFLVDWMENLPGGRRLVDRSYGEVLRRGAGALDVVARLTAPERATEARVACWVYGPQTSGIFDRVEFVPADDPKTQGEGEERLAVRLGEDGLRLEVAEGGRLILRRGYRDVVEELLPALGPESDPESFSLRLAPVYVAGDQRGGFTVQGELLDVGSGRWYGVEVRAGAEAEKIRVESRFHDGAEGTPPLGFLFRARDPKAPVFLYGPGGARETVFSEAAAESCAELVFVSSKGERTALLFSSPVSVTSRAHPWLERTWELFVRPAGREGALRFEIQSGSRYEEVAARALLEDAERFLRSGKPDAAFQALRTVEEKYSAVAEAVERARELRLRWVGEAETAARELESELATLGAHAPFAVYEALASRAVEAARRYRESPAGPRLESLAKTLSDLVRKRRAEEEARRLEEALSAAGEHLEAGRSGLAELVAQSLAQALEGDSAAAAWRSRAQEILERIRVRRGGEEAR